MTISISDFSWTLPIGRWKKHGRTADWLVGHFKDPSAYVHGAVMPPFKNLTDEQLRALTGFLQNQKSQGK